MAEDHSTGCPRQEGDMLHLCSLVLVPCKALRGHSENLDVRVLRGVHVRAHRHLHGLPDDDLV